MSGCDLIINETNAQYYELCLAHSIAFQEFCECSKYLKQKLVHLMKIPGKWTWEIIKAILFSY